MAFVFRYHFKGMILVLDTFHLFLTGLRETLADDDPAFRAFFEMHVSLNVTMAVAPGDCLILFLSFRESAHSTVRTGGPFHRYPHRKDGHAWHL